MHVKYVYVVLMSMTCVRACMPSTCQMRVCARRSRTCRARVSQVGVKYASDGHLAPHSARFKGKVTLSHFAQVGARCDACLEKQDMLDGKTCNGPEDEGRDSDHWKCAYNTRYDNGDCTADSPRTDSPSWALFTAALACLAVAREHG